MPLRSAPVKGGLSGICMFIKYTTRIIGDNQ